MNMDNFCVEKRQQLLRKKRIKIPIHFPTVQFLQTPKTCMQLDASIGIVLNFRICYTLKCSFSTECELNICSNAFAILFRHRNKKKVTKVVEGMENSTEISPKDMQSFQNIYFDCMKRFATFET